MKKLYLLIMILSVIAWWDALYLTYNALSITANPFLGNSGQLFCDFNSTFSCSEVFRSDDAKIFWLPFPAIAILVYPVIFCLALLWYALKDASFSRYLSFLAFWGMCFNGYFVSIEYFKIGAYCPLCLLCSAIITTIFITSIILWNKDCQKKKK